MTNKQLILLHDAITAYGIWAQLDMAIEEMSELTKEICKYKRGKENQTEILEEIADVLIMTEQVKLIFNIGDNELEERIHSKLCRLSERLKEVTENGK